MEGRRCLWCCRPLSKRICPKLVKEQELTPLWMLPDFSFSQGRRVGLLLVWRPLVAGEFWPHLHGWACSHQPLPKSLRGTVRGGEAGFQACQPWLVRRAALRSGSSQHLGSDDNNIGMIVPLVRNLLLKASSSLWELGIAFPLLSSLPPPPPPDLRIKFLALMTAEVEAVSSM